MKKRKSRLIISIFCGVVSSISIFCLAAACCFLLTFGSEQFMLDQSVKSNYAQQVAKEINESIGSYGYESGIESGKFAGVVSEKLVRTNTQNFIRSMYAQEPFELTGQAEVEKKLQAVIDTYGKKEEAVDNSDIFNQGDNQIIRYMATGIFERYIQAPYLTAFVDNVRVAEKMMKSALTVLAALGVLGSLAVICLVDRSWKSSFRALSFITGGASLQLLGLILVVNIRMSSLTNHLSNYSQAMNQLMSSYITSFGEIFVWFAVGMLGVTVFFWLLSRMNIVLKKVREENTVNQRS